MDKFLQVVFNVPVNRSFTYRAPGDTDVVPGCRVKAPFGSRVLTGYVIDTSETPPSGGFDVKEIGKAVDPSPVFGGEQIDLALWVSKLYFCSHGEALAAMLPSGSGKSRIQAEELEERVERFPFTLSDEQQAAVKLLSGKGQGMFYLYGITGSGKTAVYLEIAEEVMNLGRGVIYLVPEIALTHQIVQEVEARFREKVSILHSGLTPSQRMEEWKRLYRGEARIAVGARSAVFAPVHNPGLIIVDEEHEGSYKSGFSPRYHARQVAMHRAVENDALLVMGSATPSVEAYHLMNEGKLHRLTLTKRLAGGSLPELEVVDMAGEESALSGRLVEEISSVLSAKRQVILFLNRRGFSHFFHCRSCGYEMKCSHCSVALTFHKGKNRMICHYCGYSTRPVEVCPECGSLDTGYFGFGTEKIEEEIGTLFPRARIGRIDTDAVQKRGSLKEILRSFSSGELDILLGTQMVAKGLNFPRVDLVGIILADTSLTLPDFRAAERTFQLITQVAGRAGRFSDGGKVVIQTFRPDNSAIRHVTDHNPEQFYTEEIETRKMLGFPPFRRLFRLVFRGRSRVKVEECAAAAARHLHQAVGDNGEILGPAECPLTVIAGNHRFQIILRTERFNRVHCAVAEVTGGMTLPSGVYMELDVDPVSLL